MGAELKFVKNNFDYFDKVIEIIKKSKKRVCYVSYSKSKGFLNEVFEREKIKDKVFIIDCISETIQKTKCSGNCCVVADKCNLDEIEKFVKKSIKKGFEFVIFDSVSYLISVCGVAAPAGANIIIDLIKNLKEIDMLFICNLKDQKQYLVEETIPFFDNVSEL